MPNAVLDRPHGCCVHFVHFVHCSRCQCTCPGLGDASSHLRNVCANGHPNCSSTHADVLVHPRERPANPTSRMQRFVEPP